MQKIKKIAIIGSGTMGREIALVSARSGFEVIINDVRKIIVRNALKKIGGLLTKNVLMRKMTEGEKKQVLYKIKSTTKLRDVKDCDLVIEAINENVNLKKKLFKKLDGFCSESTIFGSNTSSISITELATVTNRPDKFIGIHFLNPASIIKLVEIIRGSETSDKTIKMIKTLVREIGKTPVEVNDYPGFVSNRLLMPMINEASYCLREGVATKKAIDGIMKTGMGHPMGPLELADFIGLDICLYIMEELYKRFANEKYKPCPLLRKMVDRGHLGRKSGKGFYNYKCK